MTVSMGPPPERGMLNDKTSVEFFIGEAEQAFKIQDADMGDDYLSENVREINLHITALPTHCARLLVQDDDVALFSNATSKIRTGKPTFTQLTRGDIHLCFGMQCSEVTLTRERSWVCKFTGAVVGVEHSRESDPSWTGRSSGSANPDDSAGTPVGGWLKRRDMFAASVTAFRNAHTISIDDIAAPQPKPTTSVIKRGALCVDEKAEVKPGIKKRIRASKKSSWSRDAVDKLANEAIGVINKLFIVNTVPETAKFVDPRLLDLNFVRTVAINKYIRGCKEKLRSLNFNSLHDICVQANMFVKSQKRLVAIPNSNASSSNQVRNLIANLIVSLWRAACATPYMSEAKRGSDSFRPFAAGILYSFKRGIYMSCGTCLVPAIHALAVHLPALRSSQSTVAARQLQSSSHRGICSFHRAMASIVSMSNPSVPKQLFDDAARQAAYLRALVDNN